MAGGRGGWLGWLVDGVRGGWLGWLVDGLAGWLVGLVGWLGWLGWQVELARAIGFDRLVLSRITCVPIDWPSPGARTRMFFT